MICNAKPYEGTDAFLFVSYSRKDSGIVYPLIERLASAGVRVWYDSGIHGGEIWPEVIADHLNRSAACLVFMSQNAVQSHNCFNELIFAVENKKPLIPVRYNEAQLTLGMRMMIGSVQWLDVRDIPGDSVVTSILSLEPVRATMGVPDHSIQVQAYQTGAAVQEVKKPETNRLKVDYFEATVGSAPAPAPKPAPRPEPAPAPAVPPVSAPKPAVAPVPAVPPASEPKPAPEPVPVPAAAPAVNAEKPAEPVPEPAAEPRKQDAGLQADLPDIAPAPVRRRAGRHEKTDPDDDPMEKTVAEFFDDALDRTVAAETDVPPTIVILSEDGLRHRGKIGTTTLGRSRAKADIAVNDPERKVSGCHARIICFDGTHYIEDMNSTNGTWVNGEPLEKEQKVPVDDQCEVTLYRQRVLVAFDLEAESLWQAQTLLCLRCEETDEMKYLWRGEMKLGRNNPWRDGVLTGKKVSHNHAAIQVNGRQCVLKDLNSTNGTAVNGVMLEKGAYRELVTGDVIQIDVNHFVVKLINFTGGAEG